MSWQIYAISAMVFLGVMNFFVKITVNKFDPVLSAGLVLTLSGIAILCVSAFSGGFTPTLAMAKFIVPAAIFAALGTYLAYRALSLGDASKVVPIVNLNTVVLVILAVALLKEGLTIKSGLGIVLALISIYLLSI